MAKSERYNGWINQQTWLVSLHLNNTEGSYRYWRAEAKQILSLSDDKADAVETLALQMREFHEEEAARKAAALGGVLSDLLNGALAAVEWVDVAKDFLTE